MRDETGTMDTSTQQHHYRGLTPPIFLIFCIAIVSITLWKEWGKGSRVNPEFK